MSLQNYFREKQFTTDSYERTAVNYFVLFFVDITWYVCTFERSVLVAEIDGDKTVKSCLLYCTPPLMSCWLIVGYIFSVKPF